MAAKYGLDFLLAASLVWAAIAYVWTLPLKMLATSTFMVGALLLPLAWGLSKLLRTTWTLPHNPLQPLGLWLNFAQLFYFPLLLFIFGHQPAYFIMAYGIITGAHFFPSAWFYAAPPYAVLAGVMAGGCWLIEVRTAATAPYWVSVFMVAALVVLQLLLYRAYLRHKAAQQLRLAVA